MVAANPVHPAPERLAAYLYGRLDDDESLHVEKHLSDCDGCRLVLELLPDGSLDVMLRSPPPSDAIRPEATVGLPTPDVGGTAATPPPLPHPVFAAFEETSQAKLPPDLVNHSRYEVLESLGIGGMGAVYKARHRIMDRFVALKVVSKRLIANPRAVERFRREVRAAAQLTHPNIVTAYDAEQAGDTHFLVMELVEGVSLDRLIAEHGLLSPDKATAYIRQAAQGLQHAHSRGMVHRDIKPQNLMLTPDGQIKILDFGLARFVRETAATAEPDASSASASTTDNARVETLTQAGVMMGTPDFMSPEQANNPSAADIRADIYSLGCTFYTLLAGRAPFHAETVASKFTAHQARAPQPLSALRQDVPPALLAILDRMLAKRPDERYQTPAEVLTALNSLSDVETAPVVNLSLDKKPSLSSRTLLRRFAIQFRVHRAGCSISVAVLTSVLIAVGLTIWLANREPDQTALLSPTKWPPDSPGGAGGNGPFGGMMGQGGVPPGGMKDKSPGPLVAIKDDQSRNIDDPAVRRKIEDATVFIRTIARKGGSADSTGSGFLAIEKGIVLTNAHVVHMLEPGTEEPDDITVIVKKGTTDQKELKGKVLAVDRTMDLAVIRVDPTGLPPPLEVKTTSGLQATQQVFVCGFPLGELVSNNVTIFQGKVASITIDPKSGRPQRVVLASDMQHGNTGGPCVNARGEVIGVTVAGVRGTRINFAIPGDYLHTIVNGRISGARTGPPIHKLGHVLVPVTLDVLNPFGRIQKIEVEAWTGKDDAGYTPPASTGKPSPSREGDSQRVAVALDLHKADTDGREYATGSFVLADELSKGKVDWWQAVITYKGGIKQWLPGQKYLREAPWETRPITIVHKANPGQRNVKMIIRRQIIFDSAKSGELRSDTDAIAELVEDEGARGPDKKSPVRLMVKEYSITPRQDSLPLPKDMKRVLDHTSFLDLRVQLDDHGEVVDPTVVPQKGCPLDLVKQVSRYGDSIIKALYSVNVPLANRQLDYQQKWEAQRMLSIITTGDVTEAKMDVKYQYLGRRVLNGRDQALIEMTGKLTRIQSKGNIGGTMEGRALLDLATGIVTEARAMVDMELDLLTEGIPLPLRGTVEIRLDRQLPQ
jgi:serine/threonine protein kinase